MVWRILVLAGAWHHGAMIRRPRLKLSIIPNEITKLFSQFVGLIYRGRTIFFKPFLIMLTNLQKLKILGLPPLDNLGDLAEATRLSKVLLYRLSKYQERHYFFYGIPKPSGGVREISQPNTDLKAVQAWILRNILDHLTVHSASKGFEKNTNIKDNAMPHVGSLILLCADITDFFTNVKANKVWTLFRSIGYSKYMSSVLTRLCTVKNSLPQGSPTSPKLANLCCYRMDHRFSTYSGGKGIIYTRYADDITFSGFSYNRVANTLPILQQILKSEGFSLNKRKTRIMGPSKQRKVTGLVLSSDSCGIGRQKMRIARAKIHRLCYKVYDDTLDGEIQSLRGLLSYIMDVDNPRYKKLVTYIRNCGEKHSGFAVSHIEPTIKFPID